MLTDDQIQTLLTKWDQHYQSTVPQHWGPILAKCPVEQRANMEQQIRALVTVYLRIQSARQWQSQGLYPEDRLGLLNGASFEEYSRLLLQMCKRA